MARHPMTVEGYRGSTGENRQALLVATRNATLASGEGPNVLMMRPR